MRCKCETGYLTVRHVAVLMLAVCGALLMGAARAELSFRASPMPGLPPVLLSLTPTEQALLHERPVLRLGISAGQYEPLVVVRRQAVQGVAIDYLTIVGRSVGVQLEVRNYPSWAAAIEALRAGEVDVLARGSEYEAGLADLVLSRPYVENQPVLVARGGKLREKSPELQGAVAIVEGYQSASDVIRRFPDARPVSYPSVREALHSVEYRRNEWLVGDAVTAAYHMSMGELPSLRMRPIEGWATHGYSFVFRDTDKPLRDLVDRVLADIPQLTQTNILSYWGVKARFVSSVDNLPFSEEEMQWLASSPTVRVAVSGSSPPYSFYDEDGNFQGLVADLLAEISYRTGLDFEVIDYPSLSSLLDGLQEQQADMTMMVAPGEKRRDFLDFTQPYLSNSFALIGKRGGARELDLSGVKGKRVAVLKDSVAEAFLRQQYPDVVLVEVGAHLDGLIAVAEGRAEAAVLLLPVARYLINQYFSEDLQILTSLPQLQANLPFAVRKGNPLLLEVMEKSLVQLEPGFVSGLTERWQGELPAEESVWGEYVRTLRWLMIASGVALVLLVVWLAYALIRRRRLQIETSAHALRSRLLDGIPQGIVVRDLDGRCVICNQEFCRAFGLQPEQVIGHLTSEFVGVDVRRAAALEIDYFDVLAKGGLDTTQVEVEIGGQQLVLRRWTVPYNGSDGRVAGLVMGWVDITSSVLLMRQLQLARDQAVQASEAKSSFLAVMSHEIRTPLNAIIGLLELTMRRVDEGEAWDREAIEVAYSSSTALLLLIGDILDLAKIESGKLDLEPQPCNLRDVLDAVVRVFHGLARQKGLYLHAEVELGSSCNVLLDAGRMKQVLSNLLSNAIKFTDAGGISIRMAGVDDGEDSLLLVIEVADTGIGISALDQTQLFESFTQAKGTSGQYGGTGLGLVICRQLIEMMGGNLQLESLPGKGTCVRIDVRLPIVNVAFPIITENGISGAAESVAVALSILVVDDHSPNRLLIGQQLRFLGHRVSEAEDGQQAFKLIQSGSFDVIITDCNMPVMDGYELVKRVRFLESSERRTPCRVVGFTANAQAKERQRCLDVGMDDCLFKPVGLEVLKACLNALGARQAISLSHEHSAAKQIEVFDWEMISSLTGGDRQILRMLLGELYNSNELDMRQLDEGIFSKRWREQGQLVHRLKGAARMVGASLLIQASLAYEAALAEGLPDAVLQQSVHDVKTALSQVQEAVGEWLSEPAN